VVSHPRLEQAKAAILPQAASNYPAVSITRTQHKIKAFKRRPTPRIQLSRPRSKIDIKAKAKTFLNSFTVQQMFTTTNMITT